MDAKDVVQNFLITPSSMQNFSQPTNIDNLNKAKELDISDISKDLISKDENITTHLVKNDLHISRNIDDNMFELE